MNDALNQANAEAFAAQFDPKPHVVKAKDAWQVAAWDSTRQIGYTGVFMGDGLFQIYLEIVSPADHVAAGRLLRQTVENWGK